MNHVKPEAGIQRAILDYLRIKKFVCWRNNTGAQTAFHNGQSRFIRYGHVGSGDIIGLNKQGQFFSIEVKAPGKITTEAQKMFINDVNNSGGRAFVAYSVDDVIRNGF